MDQLRQAIETGDKRSFSFFLRESSLNVPIDANNTTLLHLAANGPSLAILEKLLQTDGVFVNAQNDDGLTALHVAAMWGRRDAVVTLLKYGADSTLWDNEDMLAVDYAEREGHSDCVQVLGHAGCSYVTSDECLSMVENYLGSISSTSGSQSSPRLGDDVETSQEASGQSESDLYSTALDHCAHVPALEEVDRICDLLSYSVQHVSLSESNVSTDNHFLQPLPDVECSSDTTTSSSFIASQTPHNLLLLSDSQLKDQLEELGEYPGPITSTTRPVYLVRLVKLLSSMQPVMPVRDDGHKGFKYELALVLSGNVPLPSLAALEQEAMKSFQHPFPLNSLSTPHSSSAREKAVLRTCFNYLLLDPRNTPRLGTGMDGEGDTVNNFRIFLESVFYIGKGKNARSLQHLKDARDLGQSNVTQSQKGHSKKLQHILEIWLSGHGVMSLQLYHNTTTHEAFTREACMIDAIGLDNLTNVQRGHYYGVVQTWAMSKRRQLGVFLLYKAFQTFLIHPPQEIHKHEL